MIKDIREKIYPDWNDRPRIGEIQGITLGDVPSRTVHDINPTPPNRSKITTVDPKKD